MTPGGTGVLDLRLAGFRLRAVSDDRRILDYLTAVMVPPCEAGYQQAADWTVTVRGGSLPPKAVVESLLASRPVLASPHGGPRLAIADAAEGMMRLTGVYRHDAPPAMIEVDARRRLTTVVVPAADAAQSRWPDWLARLFFGSRMLAAGWQMLHASAVARRGTAVLFLARPQGGKSTLAHRACRETGAAFLADDLVFIGPGNMVIGWPTRVSVPAGLAAISAGTACTSETARGTRRRIMFTPAEHRAAFGFASSAPTTLSAAVHVTLGEGSPRPVAATRLDARAAAEALRRAADIPAQRLYSLDLLGLTGGPRYALTDASTIPRLAAPGTVTAVRLEVRDPGDLPSAPVWEALAPLLPELAS